VGKGHTCNVTCCGMFDLADFKRAGLHSQDEAVVLRAEEDHGYFWAIYKSGGTLVVASRPKQYDQFCRERIQDLEFVSKEESQFYWS
jgi:hypothetical protein